MVKNRRGAAKATLGKQAAEQKRNAPGNRFVGQSGGEHAKAEERAKVLRMQLAARAAEQLAARERAAAQAREERLRAPLWETVGGLVLDSARLATTIAGLPLRLARLPFRVAAAMVPRLRTA
jgi:hypothetical protein